MVNLTMVVMPWRGRAARSIFLEDLILLLNITLLIDLEVTMSFIICVFYANSKGISSHSVPSLLRMRAIEFLQALLL